MPRPIFATIDRSALRHNLSVVRQHAPGAKVWAVLKANAYGHQLPLVWTAFESAEGLAVVDFQEAQVLRQGGWKGPILLLEGFFEANDLSLAAQANLTLCIHHQQQLSQLISTPLPAPIDIYLKLNSGMNRLGFSADTFVSAWQQAQQSPNIRHITLMSHFANADQPTGVEPAFTVIKKTWKTLSGERSLANSAAILWHPATHADWVRPGIILYGASPDGHWQSIAPLGVRAVMTLRSELIAIQSLRSGDSVGYGSMYRATKAHLIGIVACGYADGYPRHAPTGTPVLVAGIRTQLLGRISMDMLAVDLTPCPDAQVGSPVELWGENLPVDEVAQAAGTLGYELLTAVTARVPFRGIN